MLYSNQLLFSAKKYIAHIHRLFSAVHVSSLLSSAVQHWPAFCSISRHQLFFSVIICKPHFVFYRILKLPLIFCDLVLYKSIPFSIFCYANQNHLFCFLLRVSSLHSQTSPASCAKRKKSPW